MALSIQFKDTWWNRLRVDKNITYRELAQYLDCAKSKVGGWFSGQYVPDRADIYKLCDLFDVDYSEGEEHFIADNANWQCERNKGKAIAQSGTAIERKPYHRKKKTVKEIHLSDLSNAEPLPIVEVTTQPINLLEALYGQIAYDTYNKIASLELDEKEPLETIYGKVSYAEFRLIERIVRG